MRKISIEKLIGSLILTLGLTTTYVLKGATVTGTCKNTIALKIIDQDSVAVFGPASSSAGTSAHYQLALVTKYAVSGCIAHDSVKTTNNKQIYISEAKVTQVENKTGTLTDLTSHLHLHAISDMDHTDTIGTNLLASGEDGAASNAGGTTGTIRTPTFQMRLDDSPGTQLTNTDVFASNFVDKHHNGLAYRLKCLADGTSGECTYSSALSGTSAVKYQEIQASAALTFPASELVMVTAADIDASLFPGDSLTLSITLTSAADTDKGTNHADYAYDSTVNPAAF
jgi:hypothetical protein